MDETRFVVSDEVWARMAPLLSGKEGDSGATGRDNRLFVEAVLWRVRTGLPWRDLPEGFGAWNSVFRRFRRWAKAGVFERIFNEMRGAPDFEYALIPSRDIAARCPAGQWTALSSRPTRRLRAQKGGSASGHRALARRADDQDRRLGRRPRQPGRLRAAAGPGA
jgi:transposase